MPGKMDLSPEERRARSERARELHRAGKFGGKEAGRKGGIATATRRQAPRPPEDVSGWPKERLLVGLVDVLRDLNVGYLRLKVAASDDPRAAEVRDLLGIAHETVVSEMPSKLQGQSLHQNEPFSMEWLDNQIHNLTKRTQHDQ